MFVFTEQATRKQCSPWGAEVKKRLIDRGLRQQDLVNKLNEKGFKINKALLSALLYGNCASAHIAEIREINAILEIPETEENR